MVKVFAWLEAGGAWNFGTPCKKSSLTCLWLGLPTAQSFFYLLLQPLGLLAATWGNASLTAEHAVQRAIKTGNSAAFPTGRARNNLNGFLGYFYPGDLREEKAAQDSDAERYEYSFR